MAVDVAARDALIAALNEEGGGGEEFVAWAESILAKNQINSEVAYEIHAVVNAIEDDE